MELAGRKALVTGARRSIGRAVAQALAQAGCDVGINDLERDADADQTLALIAGQGRAAEWFAADVSDAAQVEWMVADVRHRFGRIDILVNNAYWTAHYPFHEIPEEVWDRTLAVCLKGCFLCSQQAARAMIAQGDGGAIVHVSSVHAARVWPKDTCYGVAKAGIDRMTRNMAVDLGPHRIRCNAIQPGYVDTRRTFGEPAPEAGSAPPHLHPYIPLRRQATPEDIGRAVVFLCSPAAACITGAVLPLDGGLLATGVPS
jgi:NAD(P)-dependent dehydrogenase (short-subunit alcohol dehydrogenase family)